MTWQQSSRTAQLRLEGAPTNPQPLLHQGADFVYLRRKSVRIHAPTDSAANEAAQWLWSLHTSPG